MMFIIIAKKIFTQNQEYTPEILALSIGLFGNANQMVSVQEYALAALNGSIPLPIAHKQLSRVDVDKGMGINSLVKDLPFLCMIAEEKYPLN